MIKLKPYEGEQCLPKLALKAYKPNTKLGAPAQTTEDNECELVDQSSVTSKSAIFSSSIVRRICPSPPTAGTQVSRCDHSVRHIEEC